MLRRSREGGVSGSRRWALRAVRRRVRRVALLATSVPWRERAARVVPGAAPTCVPAAPAHAAEGPAPRRRGQAPGTAETALRVWVLPLTFAARPPGTDIPARWAPGAFGPGCLSAPSALTGGVAAARCPWPRRKPLSSVTGPEDAGPPALKCSPGTVSWRWQGPWV